MGELFKLLMKIYHEENPPQEKLIKVIGTGKHKAFKQGQVDYVNEQMAELLVQSGRATYEEKEKAEQEPEKKKEVKPTSKKVK
jgi:hypothetical protein